MSNLFFTPILNPPLGSTSTRTSGTPVRFYASMQVTADSTTVVNPDERFTVLLWYSTNGRGTWKPAPFREVSLDTENIVKMFDVQEYAAKVSIDGEIRSDKPRRDLFVLDLDYDCNQGPLQFCLKYRFSDGPWLWAGSRIGGADGRVVFQNNLELLSFSDIIETTAAESTNWHAKLVEEQPDNSNRIWDVTWKGTNPDTSILELPLGRPKALEQWMALVKIASPWAGPLHGTTSFSTSKDALLLLFQRSSDGKHVAILPVSGLGFGSAYITSDSEGRGEVIVRGMDDFETERKVQVIVAVGNDALKTVSSAVRYLKKLVMGGGGNKPTTLLAGPRQSPEEKDGAAAKGNIWEDGVSYCTWNGLGWDLSEERIIGALEQLEEAEMQVSNLMIDDNWQTLAGRNYGSSGTWSSFEANEKFPGGLKGLVSKLRAKFPYLKHIGVWHALHGYWDGITPDSALGKEYKTVEVAWRDNVNSVDKMLTMIAPEDVERFYDDFYRFLSECGIDSVKTDVQCRIDELVHGKDKAKLGRAYLDAFKKSGIKYFDQRVIYCMAHVPQILYHALLPDDNRRVFFRTSDDFYPNVSESHAWHIFTNAMNMVLYSQLHILPDWDMFQSSLPTYNSLHAAARCLSGGPIFITDTPGEHEYELLNSMVSPTPAACKSRALRPLKMAMAGDPYVAYHSNRLLQIRNTCALGHLLLGVFNVSTVALTELVDLRTSFQDIEAGREYVIRAHTTERVTEPTKILGGDEGDSLLVVGLEPSKWEVFTAAPVHLVRCGNGSEIKVAALGIAGNITGAVAVVSSRVSNDNDGKAVFEVDLCALGTLAIFISNLTENGGTDNITVKIGPNTVTDDYFEVSGDGDTTLDIDVQRAYSIMGLPEMAVITVSVTLE